MTGKADSTSLGERVLEREKDVVFFGERIKGADAKSYMTCCVPFLECFTRLMLGAGSEEGAV